MFVVFFRSPGGLEATKGPHSGARVSAAHHAAGAAARCAARQDRHRPNTRAPASDEHVHARATMRTATRTTDDRRWQAPPECAHANASDTTTPPQEPAGAAARYTMARSTTPEDASASKRRTRATIRSTGPTHDGKKRRSNQRRPSTRSSCERPPHLTSAASAPRHATKIDTPADETSDEGERRVTSVRPIASNTARAKVLRDGMHARRHNKRRESVSTRNPSTITQRENTASAAPPPLLAPIVAQCALGRGAGVEEERFRRVSREDFRRDPDSDSRLSSRSCLSSRHRAA